MATKLQTDVAHDVARIRATIEAGTTGRVILQLERGASVEVGDTTSTFYAVFPLYPGSSVYSSDGVGTYRHPKTGMLDDGSLHRLSVVVKRAYRAAAADQAKRVAA